MINNRQDRAVGWLHGPWKMTESSPAGYLHNLQTAYLMFVVLSNFTFMLCSGAAQHEEVALMSAI